MSRPTLISTAQRETRQAELATQKETEQAELAAQREAQQAELATQRELHYADLATRASIHQREEAARIETLLLDQAERRTVEAVRSAYLEAELNPLRQQMAQQQQRQAKADRLDSEHTSVGHHTARVSVCDQQTDNSVPTSHTLRGDNLVEDSGHLSDDVTASGEIEDGGRPPS